MNFDMRNYNVYLTNAAGRSKVYVYISFTHIAKLKLMFIRECQDKLRPANIRWSETCNMYHN